MMMFILTLMIIFPDGQVRTAEREFQTVHDCADAGIAFVSQPAETFDGARIAFVCEPRRKGVPA